MPSNVSGDIGRLYSPHQIFAADSSLATINLSLGERPVCEPVVAANAPLAANTPSLRARACSTRTAGERFQLILPRFTSPYSSNAFLLIIIVMIFFSFEGVLVTAMFIFTRSRGTLQHSLCLPIVSLPV